MTGQAVFRSLENSFTHVCCFRGVQGVGFHMSELPTISPTTNTFFCGDRDCFSDPNSSLSVAMG
jgi:hypothetical protein